MSHDLERDLIDSEEESFFAAFSGLRQRVVRIAEDFGDRVVRAVEEDELLRAERPRLCTVLEGFAIELTNLLTGAAGAEGAGPEGGDHD